MENRNTSSDGRGRSLGGGWQGEELAPWKNKMNLELNKYSTINNSARILFAPAPKMLPILYEHPSEVDRGLEITQSRQSKKLVYIILWCQHIMRWVMCKAYG